MGSPQPPAWQGTHRILKPKQHQVDLIDGSAVKVQIHFQLGYGRSHHSVLRGANEVP